MKFFEKHIKKMKEVLFGEFGMHIKLVQHGIFVVRSFQRRCFEGDTERTLNLSI